VTKAICSVVYLNPSTSVRMAVAVPPIRFYSSTSGSRRLLNFDEPLHRYVPDFEEMTDPYLEEVLVASDWSHVSSRLCREYAKKFPRLTLIEMDEARRCSYWRVVGRRVIEWANLTQVTDETFLLSIEDFARSVSNRDQLVELVISKPYWIVRAILYHPWIRPIRAIASVIANELERSEILARLIRNISLEDVEREINETLSNPSLHPRRRLLQVQNSIQQDAELVRAFSLSIQQGDPSPPLDQKIASSWGAGVFIFSQKHFENSKPLSHILRKCKKCHVTLLQNFRGV
jgi:hypothetical protein